MQCITLLASNIIKPNTSHSCNLKNISDDKLYYNRPKYETCQGKKISLRKWNSYKPTFVFMSTKSN